MRKPRILVRTDPNALASRAPPERQARSARSAAPIAFALAAACASTATRPFPPAEGEGYLDLRAAFHVHSAHSRDSRGEIRDLARLCRERGIDVLVVADHGTLRGKGEEGVHEGVLVLVAQEVATDDGHLVALGAREKIPGSLSGAEAIARVREAGGFAVVSHPFYPFLGWRGTDLGDGLEVYNLAKDLVDGFPLWTIIRFALLAPLSPSLAVRTGLGEPRRELRLWDRALRERAVVGIGASDSHDNRGVPHEARLGIVTTRVLAERRDAQAVLEAIRAGRVFVAFEGRAPVVRFRFEAIAAERTFPMGSSLPAGIPVTLRVVCPEEGAIALLRDGKRIARASGPEASFSAAGEGVYRVEVRRRGRLWIFSNPIRIGR